MLNEYDILIRTIKNTGRKKLAYPFETIARFRFGHECSSRGVSADVIESYYNLLSYKEVIEIGETGEIPDDFKE